MNNDLILGSRALGKSTLRRLHRPIGQRVEVLSGALWVTQDGDPRDVVLTAGEAFEFDRRGDAILSALDDSRYVVLDTCSQASH